VSEISAKSMRLPVTNAISVDVEDYFHTEAITRFITRENWERMPPRVERNTERLFKLFAEYDIRGTFFFLGWVAERYPHLVEKAVQFGHEIGCHSYWHRPVCSLTPPEFRADLRRSRAVIEDAAGIAVKSYRAPSFSMTAGTEWAVEILAEEGFLYDSSIHPIAHDMFDNRDAPRWAHRWSSNSLVEIPIPTARIGSRNLPFCGGAYFRILPYSYVRMATRRINENERRPAVFYLHPWELDFEQPRFNAPVRTRFRQYTGLKTFESKLRRLFKDFRFARIDSVFHNELLLSDSPATLNWNYDKKETVLQTPPHAQTDCSAGKFT
jgi:polysaccharide deacetylase family protein (PEP-CTERM system associated)